MSEQDERPEDHIMHDKKIEDTGPPNPFTQLTEGAFGLHEMYVSYKEAGFTVDEALTLVAKIMAEFSRLNNPDPE